MEAAMTAPFSDVRVITRLQTDPDVARMVERRVGALASDLGDPGSTSRAALGRIGSTAMALDRSRFVVIHESVVLKIDLPGRLSFRDRWSPEGIGDRRATVPQLRLFAQAALALSSRAATLVAEADPENLRHDMLFEQGRKAAHGAGLVHAMLGHLGAIVHSPSPWAPGAIASEGAVGTALPDAVEEIMPRTVLVGIEGTRDRVGILLHPTTHRFDPMDPVERLRAIADLPAGVRHVLGSVR